MLIKKKQTKHSMLPNETTNQLSSTDLSNFLDTCQTIGIEPNDFTMMIRTITDCVIDAADEYSPTRELKRPLLFLRTLETLLNNIKIN